MEIDYYLHCVAYTIIYYNNIFKLLNANSAKYLHLSIVVHSKTVCNNNILSVNYNFNTIIKWMPPHGTIRPS